MSFFTDAIVLRRVEYSDTSYVLTLLVPQRGRIEGIAKGVRAGFLAPSKTRKIDGPVDTLSLNRVTLYERKREGLTLIGSIEPTQMFPEIRRSLERWYAAVAIQELALAQAQQGVADAALYLAVGRALVELAGFADPRVVLLEYFARILESAGRLPDVARSAATDRVFEPTEGCVVGVRDGRSFEVDHAPDRLPGGRISLDAVARQILLRLVRSIRKPLDEVRLPDRRIVPLARLLQGMLIEWLDRRPVAFRYLRWTVQDSARSLVPSSRPKS